MGRVTIEKQKCAKSFHVLIRTTWSNNQFVPPMFNLKTACRLAAFPNPPAGQTNMGPPSGPPSTIVIAKPTPPAKIIQSSSPGSAPVGSSVNVLGADAFEQ